MNQLENWQDLRDNTKRNQCVGYPTTLVLKPRKINIQCLPILNSTGHVNKTFLSSLKAIIIIPELPAFLEFQLLLIEYFRLTFFFVVADQDLDCVEKGLDSYHHLMNRCRKWLQFRFELLFEVHLLAEYKSHLVFAYLEHYLKLHQRIILHLTE